jgi:hypothetical protein
MGARRRSPNERVHPMPQVGAAAHLIQAAAHLIQHAGEAHIDISAAPDDRAPRPSAPLISAVTARRAILKVTAQRDEGAVSPRRMVSMPGGGRKGRTRLTVLVYRRDMPGRKRPIPEDAMTARHALPDGLARDADIFEVLSGLAPCTRETTRSLARCFLTSRRTRWSGAGPAETSRCPWRDSASGSCPRPPSADSRTRSFSTPC